MAKMNKPELIQPLSTSATTEILKFYKDLFFKSHKNMNNIEVQEKVKKITNSHNRIDPNCIIEINKKLIRVEFPGNVVNFDRAVGMLGGIENIASSVADTTNKLQLNFHPLNQFNKPSIADKDFRPGILLKVKHLDSPGPSTKDDGDIAYEIVGVSVVNFTFNRLSDFQYLPVKEKEDESECEYIYDRIIPDGLPDLEWLTQEESKNMPLFLIPVRFCHYDCAHAKYSIRKKPETTEETVPAPSKSHKNIARIFGKHKSQISVFVNFTDKDIPKKPTEAALKLVQNKELVEKVRQLFEQRPIWTKNALLYNTGLTDDQAKTVLPVIAYHFTNGPWRISWVKFGYDPRKEPKARIYQTLDYGIRTEDTARFLITAKRNYRHKTMIVGETSKRFSLKDCDSLATKRKVQLNERCYILRPHTIPPARQMFYQLCDLFLPEVQEMIGNLAKCPERTCDVRNGWLPKNFIIKCRDIVNRYVLEAVQKELLENNKQREEKMKQEKIKEKPTTVTDYCNTMLENVKKGIYKNVNIKLSGPSRDVEELATDAELISLSSDDDEEFTFRDIIKNIPENLNEEEEDSDESSEQSSDEAEIDMEVVQEINELISELNKSKK